MKKKGRIVTVRRACICPFLRDSAWERVQPLIRSAVRGACGAWRTVHARDRGERLPVASAASWTSRPGPSHTRIRPQASLSHLPSVA
jgi:hypothetical protein